MMICISIANRNYSICIGYRSAWFAQLSFFSITREYINAAGEVDYAESIWNS